MQNGKINTQSADFNVSVAEPQGGFRGVGRLCDVLLEGGFRGVGW